MKRDEDNIATRLAGCKIGQRISRRALEDRPKLVYDMNTLTTLVWEWFEQKGLKDPVMQMVKVQEEIGELAHEISRGHRQSPEIEDALGDVLVTVIGMCHHLHYHPATALGTAYNEIKNRTGRVVEGSFIKDGETRHQ